MSIEPMNGFLLLTEVREESGKLVKVENEFDKHPVGRVMHPGDSELTEGQLVVYDEFSGVDVPTLDGVQETEGLVLLHKSKVLGKIV